MEYWIICLGTILLMIFLMFSNGSIVFTSNKNVYILCSLILGWFVSAFRSVNVGADTMNYARLYGTIGSSSWEQIFSSFKYQGSEIGFNILAKMCSYFSNNYYLFQLVICGIFCFGFYPFIKRNCSNAVLAIAVFYGSGLYLYSFNISRQMLAVMFAANAWDKLAEDNKYGYISLMLAACFFHSTAIIFLFAFIGYYIWQKKKARKYIISFVMLMFIYYKKIFILIKPLVRNYYNYANYLENNRTTQTAGMVIYFWLIIVVMSVYLIFATRRDESKISIAGMFSIIFVACNVVGIEINYFNRIGYYFMPFLIPLFDRFYYLIKREYMAKAYMLSAIVCLDIYFILSTKTAQYAYSLLCF